MSDEVAIRAVGLTRRFETVTAVDGLDLEVQTGTVFGFLGPNGAGKTTTIRLLLGLLEPTAGHASVLGHDAIREGELVRRQCGVLLEHAGLYERLSAADNLEYFGRLWHLPPDERYHRIIELLGHFGLVERRDELVGTWSRGMKQKLALGPRAPPSSTRDLPRRAHRRPRSRSRQPGSARTCSISLGESA